LVRIEILNAAMFTGFLLILSYIVACKDIYDLSGYPVSPA